MTTCKPLLSRLDQWRRSHVHGVLQGTLPAIALVEGCCRGGHKYSHPYQWSGRGQLIISWMETGNFSPHLLFLVCLCFKCVVTHFVLVEEEGGRNETSKNYGRVLCATLGACMCDWFQHTNMYSIGEWKWMPVPLATEKALSADACTNMRIHWWQHTNILSNDIKNVHDRHNIPEFDYGNFSGHFSSSNCQRVISQP